MTRNRILQSGDEKLVSSNEPFTRLLTQGMVLKDGAKMSKSKGDFLRMQTLIDEHIPPLRRIANFIHAQGSVAGVQLAHAGYKASSATPWQGGRYVSKETGGWIPVSPSATLLGDKKTYSQELTTEGIEQVILDFEKAAQRAIEAGFKVIEIHAAHGYLLNEFLSPVANHRTDTFGGNFEN